MCSVDAVASSTAFVLILYGYPYYFYKVRRWLQRYQVRTFSMYRYASGVHFRILRYGFQYFEPSVLQVRISCEIRAVPVRRQVLSMCRCGADAGRIRCEIRAGASRGFAACIAGRGNIPYCIRDHVRISTECERMYPNAYGKYMYPRSCTSAASRVSVRVSGESSPACVTPGAGMFCTPEN